jgi:hypothetical protein
MNKKLITFLSILSLFLSIPFIPANAAATAGAKCNKAGITEVVKGKSYKCIKTGKKLAWNKGVPVKPTPTPSTTPSLSPAGDLIVQEIRSALKALIPVVNTNSVDDSLIGELVVEDAINPKNVEVTKVLMRKLYVAQPIMKLVRPPVVILGHSEAFVKSEFSRRCSQDISWVGVGEYVMSSYNNWALAGCLATNPTQIIPMPKESVALNHLAGALGSDMGYVAIGLSSNTRNLPGWFVRGLKGVVGEYMTSMGEPQWVTTKNEADQCIKNSLNELSYSYEITKNWCQTSLGQGVSRYMVAKKGLKETLVFINEMQRRGSWSEADFEKFLGMEFNEFERLAKDYITRESLYP